MKSFKLALAIATIFYFIGVYLGYNYPGPVEWLVRELVKEAGTPTFSGIFYHNMLVIALTYVTSILYVGLAIVLLNGYLVGAVVAFSLAVGLTGLQVAAALLPHGVFEVPAFLAAAATGLVTRHYLRSRKLKGAISIVMLLILVTGLIALAAFIEVYITPAILEMLGVKVNVPLVEPTPALVSWKR